MGLPGSGKTTISEHIKDELNAVHINADQLRELYDDWDFSFDGRIRQCHRMHRISHEINELGRNVICDFVCPTDRTREVFGADFIIWMDTISEGRFADTNKVFEQPIEFDIRITSMKLQENVKHILDAIKHKTTT